MATYPSRIIIVAKLDYSGNYREKAVVQKNVSLEQNCWNEGLLVANYHRKIIWNTSSYNVLELFQIWLNLP